MPRRREGFATETEQAASFIFAVRQSTKRKRVTEPLEVMEFRALILELPQKMRVMG